MYKTKSIVTICIGVFALTAFASGVASAASWKVNGTLLLVLEHVATKAIVTENPRLSFSTITVECTGLEGVKPEILHPDSFSADKLVFSGCKASGGNCALVGTTINTLPVTALVLLSGVTLAVHEVVKPKTKTIFATFEFSGASCAFASEVQPVSGTALLSAPTGMSENTEQEIVANTASGELKLGSSAATLKGKAKLKLASGLPWSFS